MPITLTLPEDRCRLVPEGRMSVEAFHTYSLGHPEVLMELDTNGTIIIMSPVTFNSGRVENLISSAITVWSIEHETGTVLSSSTGFTLPDGSVRSPDAAWISDERLQSMPEVEKSRFAAVVPDFIVEVRSKTDRLKVLQTKMRETWIGNGVRLGWLIDLENEQVHIYREDGSIEIVKSFTGTLSGEEVLHGFLFKLSVLG